MCLRERELILRGKEKRQGNRARGELMHASRALKRSKRLENHPGRGAMPCDNIYIVARSARRSGSRVRVRELEQSYTINSKFAPRQPPPNISPKQ